VRTGGVACLGGVAFPLSLRERVGVRGIYDGRTNLGDFSA
jgi:hypothetical protein